MLHKMLVFRPPKEKHAPGGQKLRWGDVVWCGVKDLKLGELTIYQLERDGPGMFSMERYSRSTDRRFE